MNNSRIFIDLKQTAALNDNWAQVDSVVNISGDADVCASMLAAAFQARPNLAILFCHALRIAILQPNTAVAEDEMQREINDLLRGL